MLSALKASIKFNVLGTKASIQEFFGRHEDADRSMAAAGQIVKDFTKEFKSKTGAR